MASGWPSRHQQDVFAWAWAWNVHRPRISGQFVFGFSLQEEQRHANYNHKVLYNTKHCDCD